MDSVFALSNNFQTIRVLFFVIIKYCYIIFFSKSESFITENE
jgi:hypothetical protein